MLYTQIFKRFFDWPHASGEHVFISPSDAFNGFLVVLPFPLESVGEDIVQRGSGVLSVALSELFELGHAFGADRDCSHGPRVGSSGAGVKLRC